MWRRHRLALLLLALVTALPFAAGLARGRSFFWRDLTLQFFPLRLFTLEGLRSGELRYWLPWLHEGIPVPLPPVSYLPDLLQLAWPDERGLSWSLALHVVFAAFSVYALATYRRAPPVAAAAGGVVYALGGLCLSSLNLYVHVQAIAWAPLVVLALLAAWRDGPRRWPAAAVVIAVAISTLSVEIVAQALLVAVVLGLPTDGVRPPARAVARALAGLAIPVLLAILLNAPTVAYMLDRTRQSARQGATVENVLERPVHPRMLVQVLLPDALGDLSRHADSYWAQDLNQGVLPYFSSLHLGGLALCVAGLAGGLRGGRRLGLLATSGLVVACGAHAGLAPLVAAVPESLRIFRFPVKAFFTVHLAVALLVAHGVAHLVAEDRAWRRLAAACGIVGALLLALAVIPGAPGRLLPEVSAAYAPRRALALPGVANDALVAAAVLLAGVGLAVLVWRGALAASRASLALVAVMAAELVRGGAGVNPMVTASYFQPSPEVERLAHDIRASQRRAFPCEIEFSDRWRAGLAARGQAADVWVIGTFEEAFAAFTAVRHRVPTAFTYDQTGFIPVVRRMSDRHASCDFMDEIVPFLRQAAVGWVLSYDPLTHPAIVPDRVIHTARMAPLALYVYRVEGAPPLRGILYGTGQPTVVAQSPGREVDTVDEAGAALLVWRDGFAPGWRATVGGVPAPVVPAERLYRAVAVPPGRQEVVTWYEPPLVRAAAGVAALAGVGVALLAAWAGRRGQTSDVSQP